MTAGLRRAILLGPKGSQMRLGTIQEPLGDRLDEDRSHFRASFDDGLVDQACDVAVGELVDSADQAIDRVVVKIHRRDPSL